MNWYDRQENWQAQSEDARNEADVDYARVIHSASFRRLQGKTQILNLGDSDFYRTRLTHSLEVAQIAGGVARQLRQDFPDHPAIPHLPDHSLIQAIGITHDLGHPPFGHGGEVALNYCMRQAGGFEGNGQTLRILARLEKFSAGAGANLMRRTLLGVLKYPVPFSQAYNPACAPRLNDGPSAIRIIDRAASKPPKCYLDTERAVAQWVLAPLSSADREAFTALETRSGEHHRAIHKSFDCSIMDVADDIGFGVHDLEDALALGLMGEEAFRALVPEEECASFLVHLKRKYPGESENNVYERLVETLFGEGGERKRCIGRMVHHLITHCRIETVEPFEEPLIRYRAGMEEGPARFLAALKHAVYRAVIQSAGVRQLEFKGQQMVVSVFEALASEPETLLPAEQWALVRAGEAVSRVICDYIAGMTDGALLKAYDRLFSPRMGSIFDRF
ncbi:anti-phage deoxyguanosine triphosphatase [Sphingobium chlorophenolicum]|uniref:Deoxyguanosinetriphosphate triphosphohydrolase n=1 Tax=Sphingobium chlorophenolicum TaxID=46429 RepID=A0A081RBT0_SPHCR|nr:anti-phage deoxyguanosine triphosphatase [Sphingobium chlorophenolicum]KEQ52653.1 Deoxyguanosinetriphosphate triphosphohydrolase [Sphingobium chlorophenolicum]